MGNPKMNHALREYTRQAFAHELGAAVSVKNAEISVLNWAVQSARRQNLDASWENPRFRAVYKTKVQWLLTEMRRPGSTVSVSLVPTASGVGVSLGVVNQLVHRLQTKELDIKNLAKYPPDVLWPEGPWAVTMMKWRQRDLDRESAKAKEDASYAGMFTCKRCRKTTVTYTQAQTRSADEPSALFPFVVFSRLVY